MAVNVIALPQDGFLKLEFGAEWNWLEYQTAVQQAIQIMQSVPVSISLIFDFSQSPTLAKDFSREYLAESVKLFPMNLGLIACVGTRTPSLDVITTYFLSIPKTQSKTLQFDTLNDACSFLKRTQDIGIS